MLVIAAGASLLGCGRLGYDAIDDDAPDGDAAIMDATVDGDGPLPDATVDAAPDASPDAGPCTNPADCGATSACVEGKCTLAQRVFVTAAASNAAFGDLSGGDGLCQLYADTAQLGGSWKAWLSSSTTHARDRLSQSTLPFRRLDGVLVANDWNGLVSGTLTNPITVDENLGLQENAEVWTGTNSAGAMTSSACADWSNGTINMPFGTVGLSSATGATWSSTYLQFCDRTNVHLYCVEQ